MPEGGVPEPGKRKNAPPCDLSDLRAKVQLNHFELEFYRTVVPTLSSVPTLRLLRYAMPKVPTADYILNSTRHCKVSG